MLTVISGSPDYNKCNTENAIKITKAGFKNFRDEYAEMQKPFRGCSISADEKFIFCYNNYMKQWRHSYYADYYIFDIEKGQSSTVFLLHMIFIRRLIPSDELRKRCHFASNKWSNFKTSSILWLGSSRPQSCMCFQPQEYLRDTRFRWVYTMNGLQRPNT